MTLKGVNKIENEDRILVHQNLISNDSYELETEKGIFAVADGVGGNEGGAIASDFLLASLSKIPIISQEALISLNSELLDKGIASGKCNMASTLAGLCIERDAATIFSVGNSRVYFIQNGKYLKQMTVDDTVVQHLLERKQLKESDIPQFPQRNEITACFGGGNAKFCQVKVEIKKNIPKGFVITSDGIHDFLTTDELEDLISQEEYGLSMCENIVSSAIKRGSLDDVSIMIGVS